MFLLALLLACGRPVTLSFGLPPPQRLRLSEASLALDGLRLDACGDEPPTTVHIGDRIGATSLLELHTENLPAGEPCGLTLRTEAEAAVTLHLRGETEAGTAFVVDAKAADASAASSLRLEAGEELTLLIDGDLLLPAALIDDRAAAGGSLSVGPDDPLALQVADALPAALFVGSPAQAELRFGAAWTTFSPAATAAPEEEPAGCGGGDPPTTDSATAEAEGSEGEADTAAEAPPSEERDGCGGGEDTGADEETEERRGCDRGDDTSAALLPLGLGLIAARRRRPPRIAPPRP